MIKLLIYDFEDTNFDINNKRYDKMIKIRHKQLREYYIGGIINPPFVDKIIVCYRNYTDDNIKMLYNTLNINGKLCLINTEEYKKIFDDYIIKKKFIIIQKKTNIIYTFLKNRVIEFIIMGVQKGGTTALAHNISKHPDIYINPDESPYKSEMRFFSTNWTYGINYYKSFFDYSKKLVGEKTPIYIYLPHTFPLIQQINPYVKLIITLRNPVNRAYSHYKMYNEKWGSGLTFEEEIENELKLITLQNKSIYNADKHFINRGFYYNQLVELFKWFPRHNILILLQEEILKDMEKEYNKVYNFLNIDQLNNQNYSIVFDAKNKDIIHTDTYNRLMNIFKEDILKLEELLNIKTNWY